jgi:hypothetical protein
MNLDIIRQKFEKAIIQELPRVRLMRSRPANPEGHYIESWLQERWTGYKTGYQQAEADIKQQHIYTPCPKCNDTGVIETGNNDLPCDCKSGDEAMFNVGFGTVRGAEIKQRKL